MTVDSRLEIIEGAKHGLRDDWRKVIEITHLRYNLYNIYIKVVEDEV